MRREDELGANAGVVVIAALVVFVIIAVFLATRAGAQEHSHSGAVGEFYMRWMQPPMRVTSCCNRQDCYATAIKLEDGRYYALRREDGRWLPIPPGVLEQQQKDDENILNAPDGRSHACIQAPEHGESVYCATLGSEM